MKSTSTKTRPPLLPQFAFYGICIVAASWLVLAVVMETHFGMPHTGSQWIKRSLGWALELWLVRSLFFGIRRSRLAMAK